MFTAKILQKKYILVIALIILLLGIGAFLGVKKLQKPEKVHYHAGFAVFNNGKKLDFSDYKYMYVKPCLLNKKNDDVNSDTQLEKAHLHDKIGDVVHIESIGAKWSDLFTNIHYQINYQNVVGYINGKKITNFQNQPIHNDDVLAVFMGTNVNIASLLAQAPTIKYIETEEKKSSSCSD